ncbi:Peroxisome biosynthesis protein pex1, partial [Dimargaris verticillata]
MPHSAVVHLAPIRTCFVNLPAEWTQALWESAIVKLLSLTTLPANPLVGSITSLNRAAAGRPVIEIDNALGSALGLAHGCPVEVDFKTRVPSCDYVEVEPIHADDWEIIELNAGLIEQALLTQVRLVALNQPLTFWVSDSIVIRLHVTRILPSNEPHALLANESEIAIAPKSRRPKVRLPTHEDQQVENRAQYHCVIVRALVGSMLGSADAKAVQQPVSPSPDVPRLADEKIMAVVTVHPDTVASLTSALGDLACRYFIVQPAYRMPTQERRRKFGQYVKPNIRPTSLPVRDSAIVQVRLDPTMLPFYAHVSDVVMKAMGITRLDHLRLSPWMQSPVMPPKLHATLWSTAGAAHYTLTDAQAQRLNTFITTYLKTLSATKEPLVLNDKAVWCGFSDIIGQVLRNEEQSCVADSEPRTSERVCSPSNPADLYAIQLSFTHSIASDVQTTSLEPNTDLGSSAPTFTVLDTASLTKLVVETNRDVKAMDTTYATATTLQESTIGPLGGIDALLDDLLAFCQTALEMQSPTHTLGCLLTPLAMMLCGRTGSGKSSVCQWLRYQMSLQNPLLSTAYIDCRELGAQPNDGEEDH